MDLAELTGVRVARTDADLRLAPGEAFLGGGSWLYSTPQPHLRGLVDLAGMGWPPVEELRDGGVRIAGTCTVAELVAAASGWTADAPARAGRRASAGRLVRSCAEAFLMSFKVWQVATVGGNICLALPAGAMISLTTALDGVAELVSAEGGRDVAVLDLVTGAGTTQRRPEEALRGVRVDAAALRATYAVRTIALTPVGRSSSVVVARRDAPEDGGGCTVTVTAATTRPVRVASADVPSAATVVAALRDAPWYADPHGPADWRAGVTEVLVADALAQLTAAGDAPVGGPADEVAQ